MREIKFRAWDGNKYLYLDRADFEVAYCGVQVYAEFGGSRPLACDLEQFTGLKDKKGKEIYEGDIVREQYGYDGQEWLYYRVVFGTSGEQRHGFYIDKYPAASTKEVFASVEIIGNIHKNPELVT